MQEVITTRRLATSTQQRRGETSVKWLQQRRNIEPSDRCPHQSVMNLVPRRNIRRLRCRKHLPTRLCPNESEMPSTRLSTSTASVSEPRRRRSSHLLHCKLPFASRPHPLTAQPAIPTIKPGIYGLQNRPIAFAPNVTPGTFVEPDSLSSVVPSTAAVLFPPSEKPAQEPIRKRHPPGKRPSQGYIPRPPNAFMLFRADFVKQRHVPGSIETNHGSLSKIIGEPITQLPDRSTN